MASFGDPVPRPTFPNIAIIGLAERCRGFFAGGFRLIRLKLIVSVAIVKYFARQALRKKAADFKRFLRRAARQAAASRKPLKHFSYWILVSWRNLFCRF
jgi:predicted esterase